MSAEDSENELWGGEQEEGPLEGHWPSLPWPEKHEAQGFENNEPCILDYLQSFHVMERRHHQGWDMGSDSLIFLISCFSFFSPLSCSSVCEHHPRLSSQRERQCH